MNEMELVTDVPVIEMELDVVTRNYPVIPNPEGTPTDDISSMEIDNVIYAVKDETARTELENKVDKVEGKGLSTNDFTNALKSKLDGIEAGAEVNVQSDFAQNDNTKDDFIKNKPTKLSDFDNDEGFIDKSVNNLENYYKKSETYTKSEVNSALDLKVDKVNGKGLSTNDYDDTAKGIVDNVTTNLATKVDKVEGKGLSENDYTDTDKTKLDGIEAEANKTVVDVMISPTSTNPVQNRAIYDLLNDLLPEATATGNPLAITNASGLNAKSLKVELEPIQDTSGGEPSPEHICPISGRTQTVVSVNSEDTTIPFNQTVYGGTCDVVSGGTSDEWGYITLDGTQSIALENWRPTANSVGWIYYYDVTYNEFVDSSTNGNIKSNKLPTNTYTNLYNGEIGIAVYNSTNFGICIQYPDTSLTTRSAINTFLSNNPITVCYKKATPNTISTPSNEISLLKGANTLVADGDMELVYSKTPQ